MALISDERTPYSHVPEDVKSMDWDGEAVRIHSYAPNPLMAASGVFSVLFIFTLMGLYSNGGNPISISFVGFGLSVSGGLFIAQLLRIRAVDITDRAVCYSYKIFPSRNRCIPFDQFAYLRQLSVPSRGDELHIVDLIHDKSKWTVPLALCDDLTTCSNHARVLSQRLNLPLMLEHGDGFKRAEPDDANTSMAGDDIPETDRSDLMTGAGYGIVVTQDRSEPNCQRIEIVIKAHWLRLLDGVWILALFGSLELWFVYYIDFSSAGLLYKAAFITLPVIMAFALIWMWRIAGSKDIVRIAHGCIEVDCYKPFGWFPFVTGAQFSHDTMPMDEVESIRIIERNSELPGIDEHEVVIESNSDHMSLARHTRSKQRQWLYEFLHHCRSQHRNHPASVF